MLILRFLLGVGLSILFTVSFAQSAPKSSIKSKSNTAQTNTNSNSSVAADDSSISSNPAAVNVTVGSGVLQQYIEKELGIQDNRGVALQGAWMGDTNQLFSGGIPDAKLNTDNSVLLLNLNIDMERFTHWRGGVFNAAFLQQNAQNTNAQAGVFQGYNSLPDIPPFNRSELYNLWYQQALFNQTLFIKIGKTVTTLDFNNVIKPDALEPGRPNIPAVTSLMFTPIFINPAVDGIMPGYTNSAYGITLNFTPIKQWYLSYGVYDGNLAQGKQTGLTGPTFNGSYFHVAETGAAWVLGKHKRPGNIGVGIWRQTGLIKQQTFSEPNASGLYAFGSQRLWYKNPGLSTEGISGYYQYGVTNSTVLPMTQYMGCGLTAFGLIGNRLDDSLGLGTALSWLNKKRTNRSSELMFQIYYQAKVTREIYVEPAISYIPTPGINTDYKSVWSGTIRGILLF
ncbi:MAG: carbohydrate porin [Gammaproteobacteria bacterium]